MISLGSVSHIKAKAYSLSQLFSPLALSAASSGHIHTTVIWNLAQDWWNGINIDSIWAKQITPPSRALLLFHSSLHLLSSRLICHYLFLSHSLSSPFCCCLSFHTHCVAVCQSPSLLGFLRSLAPLLLVQDSPSLLSWVRFLMSSDHGPLYLN